MIDKDGKYKYSPVLPLFINCKTTQVNTYPNPVQNGLLNVNIITIDNKSTEAVLIHIAALARSTVKFYIFLRVLFVGGTWLIQILQP